MKKQTRKKSYEWIKRLDGEVVTHCLDVLGDGRDERFGCTNEGLANMTFRLPTPVELTSRSWGKRNKHISGSKRKTDKTISDEGHGTNTENIDTRECKEITPKLPRQIPL